VTRILVLAFAALAVAVPALADEASVVGFASTTAIWDGMLHVKLHCAGSVTCSGTAVAHAPGETETLAATDYGIAAGQTESILFDPGSTTTRKLASLSKVGIRLDPSPQPSQSIEGTLDVKHETADDNSPVARKPRRHREPTRFQSVTDRRGDSHDSLTHMDIVGASARRRGRFVVFTITTAKPPPNIHDGFGNPAAPCLEIPKQLGRRPGPHAIETCGDAKLRGYTMKYWPKVPFHISGRTSTWKIPLKYLPKRVIHWRAFVGGDVQHLRDAAPDRGYKKFNR
jgi:hypothetical protein